MKVPLVSTLTPGSRIMGFEVVNLTRLPGHDLLAYELEHLKSGARVLHFHGPDRENLFSINFPTVPPDDTGLPHIMEHAVLSGSRRFPVRDPFFEMYKMSMATFINAMTGIDCTYYPVSSNVRRDLFNLAEVYFDAVFHPLLEEETFRREGFHLKPVDPEKPAGPLTYNGIVYNEMKAAYSQPETRLWSRGFHDLFPDTGYGNDSGGNPDRIPELTYERFVAFHREYYHPSNAYFVLYGDIPVTDSLAFLAPRLREFDRRPVPGVPARQPRWSEPRFCRDTYDIGDESRAENTYLQINWIAPGVMDPEEVLLLKVLSLVLTGDDAAPLKRTLIDSGLGQDLLPSGHMPVGIEGVFTIGIRGSEEDRLDRFRSLVMETLRRIATEGVPPELLRSAFRKVSYELREIKPMYPLHVAGEALSPWILGGDPLAYLTLEKRLEACRRACLERPRIFSDLLREHLLDNPHRLDLVLAPDPEWTPRRERRLRERLGAIRRGLSDEQARELAARAAELERRAGVPNSPEALASLPQLARGDLPETPETLPTFNQPLEDGNAFLRNEVFSNGINYFRVYIDLEGLPEDLWDELPYFLDTLNKLGAGKDNYATLARRISAATGDFHARFDLAADRLDPSITRKGIVIGFKSLDEQIEPALDILCDKLFCPDPRDRARFRDVLVQKRSSLRDRLLSGGPSAGLGRLMAALTESGFLNERLEGGRHFRGVRDTIDRFDTRFDRLVEAVDRIGAFLRERARYSFSFTGSDPAAERVRGRLREVLARMRDTSVEPRPTGFRPRRDGFRLGLAAPMDVAHCAQVVPAVAPSHPDAPLIDVGMALLRVDYMVNELRFKGNAYGASCSFPGEVVTLSTYADPHIVRTLKVFAALPEYVRSAPWTETELLRAVISVAKNYVRPIRPEAATESALLRHVLRATDALRAERYRGMLEATPRSVKSALLSVFRDGFAAAPVAVVASRSRLLRANEKLENAPLEIEDLLGGGPEDGSVRDRADGKPA